jgi:hypothetical protein
VLAGNVSNEDLLHIGKTSQALDQYIQCLKVYCTSSCKSTNKCIILFKVRKHSIHFVFVKVNEHLTFTNLIICSNPFFSESVWIALSMDKLSV